LVSHRTLLSLLLICSILTPLAVSQSVIGQTMTATSTQYLTSTITSTAYSTIQTNSTTTLPLSYETRPYDYNYQTKTFSLSQMDTIPMQMDFEDYPCLYYDYFVFNATAGHEIRGHFDLSVPGSRLNFFIISQSQFRNFGNCGFGHWSWNLHVFASSFDFDWVVPESGLYVFLFASREFYGGYVHLTTQDLSTTLQSSTETFTATSNFTYPSYEIVLSTLASVSSQQSSSAGYDYGALIVVVILVVALGLVFMRMKRRR